MLKIMLNGTNLELTNVVSRSLTLILFFMALKTLNKVQRLAIGGMLYLCWKREAVGMQ